MKRGWTKIECDFLRENYGKLSLGECAFELNRTAMSVKQKARRLGLSAERRNFTSDELNYIELHYSELGPIEIGKRLGVKRDSVFSVAQKLGLKMAPKARGKISTRTNTGRKMTVETKQKIGDANRKYDTPHTCMDCGKIIAKRNQKRCRACELKSRGGEGHMWWKGGVSALREVIMQRLYPEWKLPIMERDGFKCVECGSSKNLEVHHLRMFYKIRDKVLEANPNLSIEYYDDKKRIADLVIAEHSLEDGITLCRPCHEKRHWEKRDELLGTPNEEDEGNQQPSASNVIDYVGAKVQRLTGEDSQPINPTRASRVS